MNRMNVNFFICENSFIICFVWGLFFVFVFFSFLFPLHLVGERVMADMGVGCRGALSVSGLEVMPGSHSLAHFVSHILSFSFKIGILHVEPAIEDSEN